MIYDLIIVGIVGAIGGFLLGYSVGKDRGYEIAIARLKTSPGKIVEDINPLEYVHCNPIEVPKNSPWETIDKKKFKEANDGQG